MLLANKMVAFKMKAHPFIYRVHDRPDMDKLSDLHLMASEYGLNLKLDNTANIKESLNNIEDHEVPDEVKSILRNMAIRSMAKAAYSSENIGHFGLGFEDYTHFTSPIRSYSDIIAHRLLYSLLTNSVERNLKELENRCKYISGRERAAIEAERASVKLKQVEYLSAHIGEQFKGVVSGIIDRGIFVELSESRADGLISFSRFRESFNIHPARIKAVGEQTGKIIRIGDIVSVRLIEVNIEARRIELEPVLQKI
jgi:ribonuclease R